MSEDALLATIPSSFLGVRCDPLSDGHGNKSDPKKKVSVSCIHSPHSIVFTIADEGPGFDYYNLPDPTSPENLEKECGRGIFLMKHLTDQLIFSENGRVVELNFKLSGN